MENMSFELKKTGLEFRLFLLWEMGGGYPTSFEFPESLHFDLVFVGNPSNQQVFYVCRDCFRTEPDPDWESIQDYSTGLISLEKLQKTGGIPSDKIMGQLMDHGRTHQRIVAWFIEKQKQIPFGNDNRKETATTKADPSTSLRSAQDDSSVEGATGVTIGESVSWHLGSDKDGNAVAIYHQDEATVNKFYEKWKTAPDKVEDPQRHG